MAGTANYDNVKLLSNTGHFQTLVRGYLQQNSNVVDIT